MSRAAASPLVPARAPAYRPPRIADRMPSLPRRLAALAGTAGILSAAALLAAPTFDAADASTTIVGPDVSSYQHPNNAGINWGQVKRAGASFAIVKATEGTTYTN